MDSATRTELSEAEDSKDPRNDTVFSSGVDFSQFSSSSNALKSLLFSLVTCGFEQV